ncbi:receptor-like protein 7 [Apium graveolens]|uniref:receptor-like protein 7 n=1 Tax=Apium graveolens TaxID=4045 RepID=UPI003D7A67CB
MTKFPHFLQFQDELEDLFRDDNRIEGLIPEWIWNKSKESMDSVWLGGNQLTGFEHNPVVLPWTRLRLLALWNNMMEGSLTVPPASTLAYFASGNRMTGEISHLICNVKSLIVLELSDNNLVGKIPSCLGNFSNDLMILDLKRNNFKGSIPEMRDLPLEHFKNCDAMKFKVDKLEYMNTIILPSIGGWILSQDYDITITNKGTTLSYEKVSSLITFVDLSSNKFTGKIPNSIESFKNLHSLNLSNNILSGSIPTVIGNLTALESFDISQNNLTGKIPQQLAGLGFLAIFDVSFNHLTGPIPQGKQFNLFQNDSYKGNMALCGSPLSCGEQPTPSPPLSSEKNDDSDSFLTVIIVSIGFGSRLIIGIIYGRKLATRCSEYIIIWFLLKLKKKTK